MKLLHIADLHIGKVVNGFPMIDDQKHALAGVLDAACRERRPEKWRRQGQPTGPGHRERGGFSGGIGRQRVPVLSVLPH